MEWVQNNALSVKLLPMSKIQIVGELWKFMKVRKKWWLLPMILILAVFGMILVFAQTSPLAPFIYPLI